MRRVLLFLAVVILQLSVLSAEGSKTDYAEFTVSALLARDNPSDWKPQITYSNLYGVPSPEDPEDITSSEEISVDPSNIEWSESGEEFTPLFRVSYNSNQDRQVKLTITTSPFVPDSGQMSEIPTAFSYTVKSKGTDQTSVPEITSPPAYTKIVELSPDQYLDVGMRFAQNDMITDFASSYRMTVVVIVEGGV